ncbi:ornithine uptake porin CarO [Acinetobacter haemolyticus]|uniref:ornithine uptake porin CarO n=1 Tax=Acinetobacter haemolyticus TaxID=29430 RepID=UPI002DB6F843|nr:ornithine uptake porin CarO [Acinetobacter haemolyticus]MEB6676630.1 ornithine uptake porin CarO [Acinetobacter haemolyticus]
MKTLRVILAAGVLTAIAGTTFADEQVVRESAYAFPSFLNPVSVRAEVGTTGYGGAISYRVNPYVGVTLGYNGGDISWSDELKVNGSKYDIDMDNNNTYLNAEIFPWGASESLARSLYVAAGVAYIDNEYKLDRRISQGRNFTINKTDFNADSNIHLKGDMKYDNDIAPYLGFGFAPQVYKNIGVFGEVGAYYTGNPTASLRQVAGSDQTNGNGDLLSDAIKGEEQKINDKSRYEWMPVAKVGVSFKF